MAHTKSERATIAVALFVSILCRCPSSFAAGDNLIRNPKFATDLRRWTRPNGTFGIVWSSDDADGAPTSGSGEIANQFIFDVVSLRSTCVPVTGSADYQFGATAKLADDPGGGGLVEARLTWFRDSFCGSELTSEEIRFSSTTWTTIHRIVSVPADVHTASVRLSVLKANGGTGVAARARFDNILLAALAPASTTTTSTSSCAGACGDPVVDASVSATDALYILGAAVGAQSCELCVCDVTGDQAITAADSLLELIAAVDPSVNLSCSP